LKRIAWYTTLVLLTITGLIILWQFRQALLLFLLSLVTAAAFRPLIDYFIRLKLPRGLSLALSYLIILGLAAGVLRMISGPLIHEIEQATNQFATSYVAIQAGWPDSEVPFQQMVGNLLPPPEELLGGFTEVEGLQGLLGVTTDLISLLGSLGLILIFSLYWSADSIHFERLLLSLMAVERRPTARMIWRGIEKGVGAYLRSEVIQSMLAGLLLWLGYRLIGLDYPVLLAVIGSLAWLIPWFGAVIAVVPAMLVGLGSGILPGILAAAYTVVVLGVMEFVIEPRIFWRKNYSSVILVLVMLALAEAYGLIGLILAPLVSAGIQIVFKYLLQPDTSYNIPAVDPDQEPAVLISSLSERLAETREAFLARSEPHAPEIMSLIQRLESLILEASRVLDGDTAQEKPTAG
jgi:predicted PurR-regulated permease PerM